MFPERNISVVADETTQAVGGDCSRRPVPGGGLPASRPYRRLKSCDMSMASIELPAPIPLRYQEWSATEIDLLAPTRALGLPRARRLSRTREFR
jgi:hypothetical protein